MKYNMIRIVYNLYYIIILKYIIAVDPENIYGGHIIYIFNELSINYITST